MTMVSYSLCGFINAFIIIAYRINTVKNEDIYVLSDKGKIEKFGYHEDLVKDCPLYDSLLEPTQYLYSVRCGAEE